MPFGFAVVFEPGIIAADCGQETGMPFPRRARQEAL